MKPVALESPVSTNHIIRIAMEQLPTKRIISDFVEIDEEHGKVNGTGNHSFVSSDDAVAVDEELESDDSRGLQMGSNGT